MLPDRVSNPGPLTYESGALLIALRGPADYIINAYAYSDMVIPESLIWPRGYKTFCMLNSTEYEIFPAQRC